MERIMPSHEGPDTSSLDMVHVLLLLQGALLLMSGVAMLIFMGGNPLAIPMSLGVPILLFVLAAGVVRRARWARRVTVIVQVMTLLGFVASAMFGLIAALDFSLNLLTLITNIALPIGIISLLQNPALSAAAWRRDPVELPVETRVAA